MHARAVHQKSIAARRFIAPFIVALWRSKRSVRISAFEPPLMPVVLRLQPDA